MIASAAQWSYVWAAYGMTALVVAGLVAWVLIDAKRHERALADLERRGIRRRSDPA